MDSSKPGKGSLRCRAEQLLDLDPKRLEAISRKEIQALVHELAVHQIELEVQNEDLQLAQVELAQSRDKYQDLYDFAPVGYLTLNPKGAIVNANLTASVMFGIERQKLINKMFITLASRDHAVAISKFVSNSFESNTIHCCDVMLKKKSGALFYAQIQSVTSTKLIKNEQQLRLAITDVSELRRVEQQRAELARFPEENINPVLRLSTTGKLLYANAASSVLLAEWNVAVGDVVTDELKYLIADVCASRKSRTSEIKAGDRLFALTFTPVANMGYANIYGYEITEQRKLEKQLLQKEKMEIVGQLAGGVAHDFNNQLAAIVGYAEIIINNRPDKSITGLAEKIKKISMRSAELTKQLLAFARAGSSLSVSVDVNCLVEDVISVLEHTADKCIQIEKMFNCMKLQVLGDPGQLQSVILNIAINACDAMAGGGTLAFTTSAEVLDEQFCKNASMEVTPGDYAVVSISDTGVGMDAELIKHAFEPFFTTKGVGEGTGMGLASVYGTIERHKGTFAVTSAVGQGTVFTFYLPLQGLYEQQSTPEKGTPFVNSGKIRILIIEDEDMIRDFVTDLLEVRGFSVATAVDGLKGVEFYKKSWREIDLVILDMIMPNMGGHDALIRLKEINPDIRVIVSSGYNVPSNIDGILANGNMVHLYKPYTEYELMLKIEEVLS